MSTLTLVLTAVGSVLLLLFLVMKARMHAFVWGGDQFWTEFVHLKSACSP
ncbi:hypothetical protein ABVO64_001563 [Salmonella enterica]